jgi:hypothetical protein
VLTSVLPGLRELRAPLSAGVLWLVAVWFSVEPSVPDPDEASGILASAYRLAEPLSAVGLGAVLGFAAYLVGSLSVFLFSGALRQLIPTSAESRFGFTGLSAGGREALEQIARDGRQKLERILSLSGTGVRELLNDEAPAPVRRNRPRLRWPFRRHRLLPEVVLTADTRTEPPQEADERRIADLVVGDLQGIADSQLLGEKNDVFSAVDRDRAEVEFRLAVVPGLLALAVAIAVQQSSPAMTALVVAGGLVVAVGLMLDAARQLRAANDLLLNLLEHDRITAPSVTRLESRAKELADQSPTGVVSRGAREASLALQALLQTAQRVPDSGGSALVNALDCAVRARRAFDVLQHSLQEHAPETQDTALDETVLEELESVVRGWAARNTAVRPEGADYERLLNGGPATDGEEAVKAVARAREELPALVRDMQRRVLEVSSLQAARQSARAVSSA